MSKELRNILTDVLSIVDPFRDEITFVLMKRTPNGEVAAAAKSKNGNINITALSPTDIPTLDGAACFGSLPYLGAILNSSYIKGKDDFSIESTFDTSSDGNSRALRFMLFRGGKNKLEAFYQATDPFLNKMNKIKPPVIKDWPVTFKIDQDFIKDFTEVQKVHRAAPKMGGDRDDIFTLSYADSKITAVFGDKGHQSTMVLSETAQSTGQNKLNALMPMTHFQAILKLIGKGTGNAKFTERALRVDMTTNIATYSLMILAKKPST